MLKEPNRRPIKVNSDIFSIVGGDLLSDCQALASGVQLSATRALPHAVIHEFLLGKIDQAEGAFVHVRDSESE
jgi:hypothetical protein